MEIMIASVFVFGKQSVITSILVLAVFVVAATRRF
jgi:hypothetical protein